MTPRCPRTLALALVLAAALACCVPATRANQFDPHVVNPGNFEGWYTRITSREGTFGFIVGKFEGPAASLTSPQALVSVLLSPSQGDGRLITRDHFPSTKDVRVRGANGEGVTRNPDDATPPSFSWEAVGVGAFLVNGDHEQSANFTLPGGTRIQARFTNPVPWGPAGEGPEGWVHKLPIFGLQWFVYSLGSEVVFSIDDPESGLHIENAVGTAHMEKNWGDTFPSGWMWAQGENDGSARLAIAGGPTKVGPLPVTAYLAGYRSKRLDWSFHPQDPSVFTTTHDGCLGQWNITFTTATRRLVVSIHTPGAQATFRRVQCPTRAGFQDTSEESYGAVAVVHAYSGLLHDKLVETTVIKNVGLEFGGNYKCGDSENSGNRAVASDRRRADVAVAEDLFEATLQSYFRGRA